MVVQVEDSIIAVAAPSPGPQATRLMCQATIDSIRYLVYATASLLVIMMETPSNSTSSDSAEDEPKRRASKFELWQVWNAQEPIQYVRFNPSTRTARGALALIIEGGHGVLLVPASATSSRATAEAERSGAQNVNGKDLGVPLRVGSGVKRPRCDYVRTHLHLHLPRWVESVRWESEDRLVNHLEWVENGDDLLLLGYGEKLSIWKLVDDSVHVYLQRTVILSGDGEVPVPPACHFDVASSGRYVATAGKHDRIVKVWDLEKLSTHDSTPVSLFLAHTRALVCLMWSKDVNVYKRRSNVSTRGAREMLFTLDRAGNVSIWREIFSPPRSFVLWQQFSTVDFCCSSFDGDDARLDCRIREFGLVNHNWAQDESKSVSSLKEALLSEGAVMDALCLFHYGYGLLNEAHQYESSSQRKGSIDQINSKLLIDRRGAIADTHVGEASICGNVALGQTFSVHLLYAILSSGVFCMFREVSVPFTGVSPKLSLLLSYNGLQEQLIDGHVYYVSSSDYQEHESGLTVFFVEVLFQRKAAESQLYRARLVLQPSSSSAGTCTGSASYNVRTCEVSVICSSMMSATKNTNGQDAVLSIVNLTARCQPVSKTCSGGPDMIAITNFGGRLRTFRASRSLHKLESACHAEVENGIVAPMTHTASYDEQGVLYLFAGGRVHVAIVAPTGVHPIKGVTEDMLPKSSVLCRQSMLLVAGRDALTVCYADESNQFEVLDELISVTIPASVKARWSSSSMSSMDPAAIDTSEVKKDFSMVVGLHKDGRKMTVWVFLFETTTTDSLFSSVQLLRKSTVAFPGARVLGIACVPLLNTFEVIFACFDADAQLTLWTFADLDNLLEVESAHRVNVGDLMQVFSHAQTSHVALHSTDEQSPFKHFSFSSCGRVAILLEGSEGGGRICFLSTIDDILQGVVELPYEQFGRVLSLEWTPPITAEQVCHLLFVSTTAIGVLKFRSTLPTTTNKWSVAWSSSRFSVRPGKASSLVNYPHALLRIESGLAHLNIGHISGLGSSPVQLLSDLPRNQAHYYQPQTEVFPAHHPITLIYLLARGSFKTLGKVLEHVKMKVLEHEEMCYLQMTDNMVLRSLPLLSLCQLLGNSRSAKDNCDERSDTYLRGKESRGTKNVSHFKASAAPARASDLFAISREARRRHDAGKSGVDCADRLFMPPLSAHDSLENLPTADVKSVLDFDAFSKFFDEHRCSLTFMTTEESDIFLTIVAGVKKILRWERDCSRQKDEAALRFQASLLWQARPLSSVQRAADESDLAKEQAVNDSTTPMSSNQEIGGLCSEQIAWGALSDFQPALLQECFPEETMSWKEMRRLRLPFWLKSTTKLIRFLEKAAQVEYATNRNPFAVAVFYVLLGKIRLLASLFKMANESRISDLLGNNLSDVRWKNAAIKNAYVLKGKQRYELSAAFFLLGGKITEAVSVAKKADTTLVLSFLIARVSEKWEFGHDSSGVADLSQTSYTGMVTAVHGLSGPPRTGSVLTTAAGSSESKNVSVDFLRTTVYERALQRGDVYMCFLVKYLLGETSSAIDVLVAPPAVDMRSMFGDCANSCIRSSMYWSAFGKSLLSACDLIRFFRKAIAPMTLVLKERVLRLNAIAMVRSQDGGLGIAALLHQRDTASFVQEFCRERAPSSGAATFLGYRERILIAALGGQVDYLYAAFLKLVHEAAAVSSSSASGTPFDFVDRLDEEIRCIVNRGGDYDLPGVPETSKEHLLYRVRAAVVEMLVHSGRLAALDLLMSRWSQSEGSVPKFASTRPVLDLVVVVVEGLATVASGDLLSTSSDCSRTRKVDQTCFDLLAVAAQLLLWLQYYLLKYLEQGTPQANRDFVGLAVAAVHSVIAVCCRYVKNPCCLHRALGLIFSHGAGLSHESKQALADITEGDVCVRCASIHRSSTAPVKVSGISSLFEQDIPALYQVVRELGLELDEFTAAVKSRRLHHSTPLRGLPTRFSYCPYWELVMMMVAGDMPAHLSKITEKGVAPTTELSSKLVKAWENYNNSLARFASKHVLCDLAELFYGPISISDLAASPGASSRGSPRESSSPARSGSPGTPRAFFSDAPEFTALPHDFGRQLLKCECERCPWLLLVELFTDRDEFLHRLYARMDYCCEKIDGEVRWGRLPEPVSQKSASIRYQQPVLSGNGENAVLLPCDTNRTEQVKRRTTSACTATGVHVQCVYRSENAIKAMCINRATSDDAEISVCGKKGIFRASYMDHGGGNMFQSKGMHACPHNSLRFVSESNLASPPKSRHIVDTTQSSNFGSSIRQKLSLSSSLTAYGNSSPSPLRNPMPASPSEPKSVSFKPTALASHPFLPLFVSGNHKGHVHLWSYDRLSALCAFQTKDVVAPYPNGPSMLSSRRNIKALEFDGLGQQLGAVDAPGRLFLWKFSEWDRVPYYREIMCHDKGAKGLAFLNSSSTIATVGLSSEKKNVCVWDTLLPTSKAVVAAPSCHPAGATSVVYSSTHQLLVTGGAGGALSIFDMRQRRVLHTVSKAHETSIQTLVLHPSGDCMLSGSAGGDIKIWSLPLFRQVVFLSKVHVKPSFLGDAATNLLGDAASNVAINVTNSSWGVTDSIATENAFFSSGTDGSVQRLILPSLSQL